MAARRQKKSIRKMKLPPAFKGAYDALMGKLSVIVVGAIVLLLVISLAKAFLYRSDYFRLRAVEIKGAFVDQSITQSVTNEFFRQYKGRSIFEISLKGVHKYLATQYPDASDIAVTLALPDKVVIYLKFRRAIALVGSIYRQYPVDEDGYVLPRVDQRIARSLPVISGIDIKAEEKRGKKSRSKNLCLAIDVIKTAKRFKFISDIGVASVDARDGGNIIMHLRNGIEVRLGSQDFLNRLDSLEKTVKNPRILLDRIKYIDVRFSDVVVGPK